MVLNDKTLAARMKKDAKGGLKVWALSGRLSVIGMDWMASIELGSLSDSEAPRLTLAALVEMLGYIPHDCCIEISKRDDYCAQELILDAFQSELGRFAQDDPEAAVLTPLTVNGMLIFQTETLRCAYVRGADLALCTRAGDPEATWDGGVLTISDGNSAMSCLAAGTTDKLRGALEAVDWSALCGRRGAKEDADDADV